MPCVCSSTLNGFKGLLPPPIPPVPIPAAAKQVLWAASAAMNASASGSAAASASANANLSASASAQLAAMASVTADMKAMGLTPTGNLGPLAAMIESLNKNLPAMPGGIPPVQPALSELGMIAAILQNLAKLWGVNLASPKGPAQLQAKLDAVAQAQASAQATATASASASASASAAASAQASASAQAQMNGFLNMTKALGLPLKPPDPISQLAALANSLAAMKLPPVAVPPNSLARAVGMLSSLANIAKGLGVNMLAPTAPAALAEALAQIDFQAVANVQVAASLQANTAASAQADANASANASASAAASAGPSAPSGPDLNGQIARALAPLNPKNLIALATAMALDRIMKALGKPLPTSACSTCAFLKS